MATGLIDAKATDPIGAIVAIHNAFRRDMAEIDAAALGAARGKPGLEATVERFQFFNEVLEWHAHGEELAGLTLETVVRRVLPVRCDEPRDSAILTAW